VTGRARDDRRGALAILFVALIALVMFGVFAWIGFGPSVMPPAHRLASASGELRSLSYSHSKNAETLELRLDGQPLRFAVSSQAADLQRLHDLLIAEPGKVTLLYDPDNRRHPWWSEGDDFYLAYALDLGGDALLSYDDSMQGFEADRRLGRWFSPLLILVALLLCHTAWKMWQPRPA